MRLRKSLSQSLKKSVRKVKVALQIKKVKNEVGSLQEKINTNRDINDSTWLDQNTDLQDNRIESWWKTEEERIMSELRNIGKTDSIML
ncbi:unnamed protein product [Rhizophagus irregularis]|nr:unnamed protein product [Rhizophagus irregularis]GBC12529.2 hypothetical protein RIR_jg3769.t1 [Rhizophagus irregularis DAOM 181602=DAOM 197198]CAB4439139.1 unnamed protein product [Rhizophagus irregularis]CAB4492349.1 unnamed protein product [Rhizophagus irregularis]CAB5350457.1 unnamed protein product [Rhizophagus irregularis]